MSVNGGINKYKDGVFHWNMKAILYIRIYLAISDKHSWQLVVHDYSIHIGSWFYEHSTVGELLFFWKKSAWLIWIVVSLLLEIYTHNTKSQGLWDYLGWTDSLVP